MKRNWKIIRAILREENTSAWPEQVVIEHHALCADVGYVRSHVVRTNSQMSPISVIKVACPWQKPEGLEVAEALANEADLDATLRELDEKGVGHVSDIVLEMMRRKAMARLGSA